MNTVINSYSTHCVLLGACNLIQSKLQSKIMLFSRLTAPCWFTVLTLRITSYLGCSRKNVFIATDVFKKTFLIVSGKNSDLGDKFKRHCVVSSNRPSRKRGSDIGSDIYIILID